jgi:type I restriction enzyme S subunit
MVNLQKHDVMSNSSSRNFQGKTEPAHSGIDFPGDVPDHWLALRLKHLVRNVGDHALTGASDEMYLSLENIESWTGRIRLGETHTTPEGQVKRFQPGDILFGKLRPYLAKVTRPSRPGVCVSELLVLRMINDTVLPEFLEYKLRSTQVIDLVNSSTFGAKMPRADWTFIRNIPITFPRSRDDQRKIVQLVDERQGQIEDYIHSKERLIELLNEEKQTIINQILVQSQGDGTNLKPTDLKWLERVPDGWEVAPAKYYYREIDKRSLSGTEELLTVSHITGVTLRSQKTVTMFKAESYVGHKLCEPGDLVINTMWAWMGALGVSSVTGIVSPSYAVYRPTSRRLLPQFADLLLRTHPYLGEYNRRSKGIRPSRLRLYPERFLRIPIVCPPEAEQQEILLHVNQATERLDKVTDNAVAEIDLLKEYRNGFVNVAVSGKLDIQLIDTLAQHREKIATSNKEDQVRTLEEAEDLVSVEGSESADD